MYFFPFSRRASVLLIGLSCAFAGWLQAQDAETSAAVANLQQSAYRGSVAQEEIRQRTEKIQSDLGQMMQELKLNGMETSDLATLSNISNHLSILSQGDMQKVIQALQKASVDLEATKSQKALTGAYQMQKDLTLKLKGLAQVMAAHQSDNGLLLRLQNLLVRQSANIRHTASLQTTNDPVDAGQKPQLDLIRAEQSAIGSEIDLFTSSLLADENRSPADSSAPGAKLLLDAMHEKRTQETALAATQATNRGALPEALAQQTALRDSLTALLQLASLRENANARLEQATASLQDLSTAQQQLQAATKESKLDRATLAERQEQIDDQAEAAKAQLQTVNPEAATQIAAAQNAMRQSLSPPSDSKSPDAAKQTEALQSLAQAQKLVAQQMAAAQAQQNQSPVEQTAQLQQAQDEVRQAQQTAASDPKSAAASLQQAQQNAFALAPQAADKIADATNQLQQPQPDPGQIQNALAQANDELQKRKDALAPAAQAYQALTQANEQLDQAKQNANEARQNLQSNTPSAAAEAAQKLTSAEAALNQLSQNLPQNAPPGAEQAIQKAADAFKAASIQTVQGQPQNAGEATQQGLQSLQKAQEEMAQAMAGIQQQAQSQMGPSLSSRPADNPTGNAAQVLPGGSSLGGPGQVIGGLSHKDREAIEQYQQEKTAPEYAPLVQQYFKNIANADKEN